MLKAKDFFINDLDNFINTDEFGESHIINRRILNVIVDNDRLKERSKKEYEGIYVGDILYFVNSQGYGSPPKINEFQLFDQKPCKVFDVRHDMGIYEIILKFNAS